MHLVPGCVQAPEGWLYTDPNPFTQDGNYGHEWSAFCITARDDDQYFTGQVDRGPFSARFGQKVPYLQKRLADFLRYENAHGRTVILSIPEDMDGDRYASEALASTPDSCMVRPEDPAVIVHATSAAAWMSIQADGFLKAASQLSQAIGTEQDRNSSTLLDAYRDQEPPEYREYIMFGEMESCGPEMVLASYQVGRFVSDEEAAFLPGMRLYFDNLRIIADGLAVRDGLHLIKVYRQLSLQPYLLDAIGTNDIDPCGIERVWTIRKFVDRANAFFQS
jgi:hypothetical protein